MPQALRAPRRLREEGRHAETVEQLHAATAQASCDPKLGAIWRRNELALRLETARRAREKHDLGAALEAIAAGLELVDADDREDREDRAPPRCCCSSVRPSRRRRTT